MAASEADPLRMATSTIGFAIHTYMQAL